MDKLDPVLDKMPSLIDEMTITLKSVNDWIGPDAEDTGKDSGSSWNPFSSLESYQDKTAAIFKDTSNLADRITSKQFLEASSAGKGTGGTPIRSTAKYKLWKDLPEEQIKSIRVKLEQMFPKDKWATKAQNYQRGVDMKKARVPLVAEALKKAEVAVANAKATAAAAEAAAKAARVNLAQAKQLELFNKNGGGSAGAMKKGEIPKGPHYGRGVNIELKTRRDAEIRRAEEGRASDKATREKARLDKISKSVTNPEPTWKDRVNKKLGNPGSLERFIKGNAIQQSGYENPNAGKLYDALKTVVTKVSALTGSIGKFVLPRLPVLNAVLPGTLADGTLKGSNMLAPGEIGPMTELQTVVEKSNTLMDLLKPTPTEKALENNMSVITDSTGMKVRIVEDLTKGIDEDTATFGGTSNKGDDANNTANINANALNIGISTDQAVANMGKGVEDTFTSGLTDLFSGNKLNTDRMLMGLANLAKGQAASWITGIIVKAAIGEAVGGDSGTEDWEAVSDGYAKGGVLSGGFRAFASGGVVHKPTLGLIGEGNYNEAVVPLPDGKSIPVIGAGGNTNNNNFSINVTVNSDGSSESSESSQAEGNSSARQAAALGEMLTHSIQQELVKQQRPGGLLSDY
jgi:hypothetical protein